VGARATKLTEAGVAGIPVIVPVRLEAVRRLHLCAAVMDGAVGFASYIMAASPETCGQAMDVPEIVPVAESDQCTVERTDVPGAQTSMQEP
jgi:hypothetical protein